MGYMGYTPTKLRDLNPSSIDQDIVLKGLVVRATPVVPDTREGEQAM
jgi:hypothetical protein